MTSTAKKARLGFVALIALALPGCITTSQSQSSSEESTSAFNIGPLIGLIGMAVDGDDKDDYEHFFEDDCDCHR